MLGVILNMTETETLNIEQLKKQVREAAKKVTSDDLFEQTRDELKSASLMQVTKSGATTT